MKTLEEKLEQLLPVLLDGVIRANHDKAQLYFSTDDEINTLRGPEVGDQLKAQISDWAVITMHLIKSQVPRQFSSLVAK